MSDTKGHSGHEDTNGMNGMNVPLTRLYWAMRLGMAFIWLWTAVVSWFFYPQEASLEWLRRFGLTREPLLFLAGACVLDLLMGISAAFFATRKIWQLQFVIVVFYSAAIAIRLPEFLLHPFGPITKNIAVLACLAWLAGMERARNH